MSATTRVHEDRDRAFWLEAILSGSNAGSWLWNVQTGATRLNARWAEIIGFTLAELEPTTIDTWRARVHPEDLQRSQALLQRHFQGQSESYQCDLRMRHRDGHWIWVRDQGRLVTRSADGEPEWVAGTHFDISDHKLAEQRLERALVEAETLARQLDRVQRIGRLGYWRASLTTGDLYWSDVIYEIFGVDKASFHPTVDAFKSAVHPEDLPAVEASERKAEETGLHDVVHRIIRPDGAIRWVHELADLAPEQGEQVLLGTVRDVTEQKELEERLRLLSVTDPLTGLFNRRRFMVHLEEAFEHYRRYGRTSSVIMLDFDRFKRINDLHGHSMGDRVLQASGQFLRERTRTSDVSARLGGEEFAILLPQTPLLQAFQLACKLCEEISREGALGPEVSCEVTITCGVAAFSEIDQAADKILQRADQALYRGKAEGRNRAVLAR